MDFRGDREAYGRAKTQFVRSIVAPAGRAEPGESWLRRNCPVAEPPPVDVGAALAGRFPQAVGAVVAGSTARGQATASSDVDLVVFLSGRPAPMRCTERFDGTLVEFFVHTEDSLWAFVEAERLRRRSPLLHMLTWGQIVADTDGRVAGLRDEARRRWEAGPAPLRGDELDDRRYRVTALLDDLADETDTGEQIAIAATVFTEVADLALVSRGAWTGTGRWLVRRLRHVAPQLAEHLLAGLRDAAQARPEALITAARSELDRLGGPLDEGYQRQA